MNFISQTIVFALALMGTLFKSTKTDTQGNTLYRASGLPVLTTTGTVVITLLSISFCISLITIWQKDRSEDEARRRQLAAEQYSKGIDATVREVLAVSSKLSEDQKQTFQTVLTQQETSGAKIASGIRTSADLLQGRIESSSDLLSGRIGTSIDLLNKSAHAINSLADPVAIIEVRVLTLEVPFTDPSLANYRNRLENGIQEYLTAAARSPIKKSPNANNLRVYGLNGRQLIEIAPDSPLLPDPSSDQVAYNVLTFLKLDIGLLKNPHNDQELAYSRLAFDISIPIQRSLQLGKGAPDFRLAYDLSNHRALISLYELTFPRSRLDPSFRVDEVGNSKPRTEWTKPASGKITGVPDLAEAQIIAHFYPGWTLSELLNNTPPRDLRQNIDDVRRQIELHQLFIVFSGELSLLYSTQLVLWPAGALPIEMKRLADKDGFPIYVGNLPNSLKR